MSKEIHGSLYQSKAANKSAIDERYGPYNSTTVALSSIELTQRYVGLTVGISTNDGIIEYWFEKGVNDSDLVQKFISRAELNTTISILTQQLQDSINSKLAISYVLRLPSIGQPNIVYVVPNSSSTDATNQFNEYIWTNGNFELLGSFGTVTVTNYYTNGSNIDFIYNSYTNLTTISLKDNLHLTNSSKELIIGSLSEYLNGNLRSSWAGSVQSEVLTKLDGGVPKVGLAFSNGTRFSGITIFESGIFDAGTTHGSIWFASEDTSIGSARNGTVKVSGVDEELQAGGNDYVSLNDTYDFHTLDNAKIIFNEFNTDRLRPGFIIYDNNGEPIVNNYREGFFYSGDKIQYLYGSYDDGTGEGSRYTDIISVSPELNEGDGFGIYFGDTRPIGGATYRFNGKNTNLYITVGETTSVKTYGSSSDTYIEYGSIGKHADTEIAFGTRNGYKYTRIGDNYFYKTGIRTSGINSTFNYTTGTADDLTLLSGNTSIQISGSSNYIRFKGNPSGETLSLSFNSPNVPIGTSSYVSVSHYFSFYNTNSYKSIFLLGKKIVNNVVQNAPIFLLSNDTYNVYLTPTATPYKAFTNTGGYGITDNGVILYCSNSSVSYIDDFDGSDWASKKSFIRIAPYSAGSNPSSQININAKQINLGDEANASYPNGNTVRIKANTFEVLYNDGAQDWIENVIREDTNKIILQRNRSEHASTQDYVTSQAFIRLRTDVIETGTQGTESGEIFIKAGYGDNLDEQSINIDKPQTGSILLDYKGVRINYWKNTSGNGDVFSGTYPDTNAYGTFTQYGANIGFMNSNGNDTFVSCQDDMIVFETMQQTLTLTGTDIQHLADILSHYSNVKGATSWS